MLQTKTRRSLRPFRNHSPTTVDTPIRRLQDALPVNDRSKRARRSASMMWTRFRALACVAVIGLAAASPAAALTKDWGVIGGFNFSTLKIEGQSGIDARSAFAIGGVLDLHLKDRFGIRVEPMYLRSGGDATHRNAYWGTMDGAEFKLDYIGIPVLAHYDFGTNDKRNP